MKTVAISLGIVGLVALGASACGGIPSSETDAEALAQEEGAVAQGGAHRWGAQAFSAPPDAIDDLEAAMKRPFGSYSVYSQLPEGDHYPNADATRAKAEGALIYLNINSQTHVGDIKSAICWDDVSSGKRNADLDAWATAITDFGWQAHTVITFAHEPSVESDSQPKCPGDTAAAYRKVFHYVVHRLRSKGVTTRFAFVPTASAFRTGSVDAYDPDHADYSVIGIDAYNRAIDDSAPNYRDAHEALDDFYAWSETHVPTYEHLIGEIGEDMRDGDGGDGSRAKRWIETAIGIMKDNGKLLSVNWNLRTDKEHYYSPALNQGALKAWLAGAKDPYFAP